MTDTPEYTPPKVWSWNKPNSTMGRFANINRPTAGAQYEKELPVGRHPLQLYSLGTPNGVKVTIMLEELLALTTVDKVPFLRPFINVIIGVGVLIGFGSEDDWFDYRLENDPRFLARIERARASLRTGRGVKLEDLPPE